MKEALDLPECPRAQVLFARFVDGDQAEEPSAWLAAHLEACPACRAALASFTAVDAELTRWGGEIGRQSPPPAGAREHLAKRMDALAVQRKWLRPLPAYAAVAAALALVMVAPLRKAPVAVRDAMREPPGFVAIPYVPPPDPRENTTIVRMDVRVAALIAVGYRITADPDAVVPADVLVGEDGRVHAVRVLADIDWNGKGD